MTDDEPTEEADPFATAEWTTETSSSTEGWVSTEKKDANLVVLGEVSDHWKRVLASLVMATICFFVSMGTVVGFGATVSDTLLVAGLFFSVGYLGGRIGIAYYLYRDARKLREYSQHLRIRTGEMVGWTPRPYMWAGIALFVPPFVEYGPVFGYLIRRRVKVGVPRFSELF